MKKENKATIKVEEFTPVYGIKRIPSEFRKEKLNSSKEAYTYIKKFYGDDINVFESFFMVGLDAKLNTIGFVKISQGGINLTAVDIRLVLKYAIDMLATSVIISHNHPSGDTRPSLSDIDLTEKTVKGLDIVGIVLSDHIIVTTDNYYSFTDKGKL